jgi:hypothetical protein
MRVMRNRSPRTLDSSSLSDWGLGAGDFGELRRLAAWIGCKCG